MRPSRPLPSMSAGSRPCFASRLRTAGPWVLSAALAGDAAVEDAAAVAGTGAGGGTGLVSAGLSAGVLEAAALSLGSRIAITSSLSTVSPLLRLIDVRTPSAGHGTSRTTLSVSISTRFSSRRTVSPGCLCQSSMVASELDLVIDEVSLCSDAVQSFVSVGGDGLGTERTIDQCGLLLLVPAIVARRG